MFHDVPGVIVGADNPHVSCLGVLVLNERGFPSHVIDGFAHDVKIKGKEKGWDRSPHPSANL